MQEMKWNPFTLDPLLYTYAIHMYIQLCVNE